MDEICNTCGIDSWKMGTCIDVREGDDDVNPLQNNDVNRQFTLPNRMMQQQSRLLEDMEAAFEEAFVDMLSSQLAKSRAKETAHHHVKSQDR